MYYVEISSYDCIALLYYIVLLVIDCTKIMIIVTAILLV